MGTERMLAEIASEMDKVIVGDIGADKLRPRLWHRVLWRSKGDALTEKSCPSTTSSERKARDNRHSRSEIYLINFFGIVFNQEGRKFVIIPMRKQRVGGEVGEGHVSHPHPKHDARHIDCPDDLSSENTIVNAIQMASLSNLKELNQKNAALLQMFHIY